MHKFTTAIPLTLYVHLPWCIRKCPYCDFNSHALKTDLPEQQYIHALIKDLDNDLSKIANRELVAIFFGGGTPSLFSPKSIELFLNAVSDRIKLVDQIEITMEANPGTVEQAKFKDFYSIGVNRLSLGIQSFHDQNLKALGRIHNGHDAQSAIECIQQAGFTNFNLDLMHGLPDQTIKNALDDLKLATTFQPSHLSWYQLTLEPNTAFFHNPPKLPANEKIWQMQDEGKVFLAQQGYQQYEISAYCRPGYQCQHNCNYWEFGDYLGIGAGAHSKITDRNTGTIERFWKTKHPKHYLSTTQFIAETKVINNKEIAFEFMLNHLRLLKEIPVNFFEIRTNLSIHDIKDPLNNAQQQGFLIWNEESIVLTSLGKRFVNDVLEVFLP